MPDTINKLKPTLLLGLIGQGISASRAPALHMKEGMEQGLTTIYKIIDFDALKLSSDDLARAVRTACEFGFAGLNITHPYKQMVIQHLDALSPHAEILQAVNTVVFKDGKAIGNNTDWSGYYEGFQREMAGVKLGKVVQYGAGGAGVAVLYALLTLGVEEITLIDVDPKKVEECQRVLSPHFGANWIVASTNPEASVKAADGIVNATPIGMAKYPGTPFPTTWLKPSQWVSEVIYVPLETQLLKDAAALGCKTIHGGHMNIFQAVDAFRLFTGLEPDSDRMGAHFRSM